MNHLLKLFPVLSLSREGARTLTMCKELLEAAEFIESSASKSTYSKECGQGKVNN